MWINFNRLCRRMYREIGILRMLQDKLGFFIKRDSRARARVFFEEPYHFPKSYFKEKYRTIKEFEERQMNRKDRLYGDIIYIFKILPISLYILTLVYILFIFEYSIEIFVLYVVFMVSLTILNYICL